MTSEVLRPGDTVLAPRQVEAPVLPAAPLALELPGRYQLGAELARGGQSIVYVAYDSHLGREVAFKTLLPEGAGSSTTTLSTRAARFVREARVTAQLEHPGIAPVHEVGQRADGSFYATQKLVRGKTLEALLRACASPAERYRLLPAFLGLCQAVAYAHQRGVIHRDLKPGNMMVGALGEAVVIDWGLARTHGEVERGPNAPPVESLLDGAETTRDGAILGTPAYMSPEQAVGASGQVDARSDVWGLGVILYELLAGSRPFSGTSTAETLREVATAVPQPVREVCPDAPPELAAVVERALQRDPRRRYPSAAELAAEVGRWLSGDRVVSYEYGSWELAHRFVRRNRASTLLALLVLLGAAAAALVTRARYVESRLQLAESLAKLADGAVDELRWDDAAVWYAASRVQDDSPRARLGLAFARSQAPRPLAPISLEGVTVSQYCRSDAGLLATAIGQGGAEVIQAETGAVLSQVAVPGVLGAFCALEAGLLVTLSGGDAGALVAQRWALDTGRPQGQATFPGLADFAKARVSPDGTRLAVVHYGEQSRNLSVLTFDGGARSYPVELAGSMAMAFEASGDTLWWVGPRGPLWSLGPDPAPAAVRGHSIAEACALLVLDGGAALVGTCDGALVQISGDPDEPSRWVRGPAASYHLTSLGVSADGTLLASVDRRTSEVILWDWTAVSPKAVAVVSNFGAAGHQDVPAILSADGSKLFATLLRESRSILMAWRTPDHAREVVAPHEGGTAALSPGGRRLAFIDRFTRSGEGFLEIIEVASGRRLGRVPSSNSYMIRQTASFGAGDRRLAVLQADGIEINDLDAPEGPRRVATVPGVLPPIALSPDGLALLAPAETSSTEPPQLRLWSVERGEALWTVPLRAGGLAFTPDGARVVAVGDDDPWVAILDARTGRELRRWMLPQEGSLLSVAVSDDGSVLAVGGQSGVWRVDVGAGRVTHLGTDCAGWSVAISADGEWIAASGARVWLWRGGSTAPVLNFLERGYPSFAGLSPDGRTLYHAGSQLLRLELGGGTATRSPEAELAEVQREFRLAFDGQKVVLPGP